MKDLSEIAAFLLFFAALGSCATGRCGAAFDRALEHTFPSACACADGGP